jgi:hypothetical protein
MGNVAFFIGAPLVLLFSLYQWGGSPALLTALVGIAGVAAYRGHRKSQQEAERERRRAEQERAAQEQAEVAAQRAQAERQRQLRESMQLSRETAVNAYVRMPEQLLLAEQHLDGAEAEFERRAFSPFWEQVEAALRCLGQVYSLVQMTIVQARSFRENEQLLGGYGEHFPVVESDTEAVRAAADATHARLGEIVRKSQTDFQFSTIYEQRKTNSILIQGFRTLGDAINGLSTQLSSSFEMLSTRLGDLERRQQRRHEEALVATRDLGTSLKNLERSNSEGAAAAARQREGIAGEQASLAMRQLAMLDNIQRGRRPSQIESGPRGF